MDASSAPAGAVEGRQLRLDRLVEVGIEAFLDHGLMGDPDQGVAVASGVVALHRHATTLSPRFGCNGVP